MYLARKTKTMDVAMRFLPKLNDLLKKHYLPVKFHKKGCYCGAFHRCCKSVLQIKTSTW